jgi:hypothetical protein
MASPARTHVRAGEGSHEEVPEREMHQPGQDKKNIYYKYVSVIISGWR